MEHFIGCDAHKKFPVFASINEKGEYGPTIQVRHDLETFREFLKELPMGSKIALETSGCYYWMVDEMERAGRLPQLAHALTAERRMEGRHKTNDRDAKGFGDAAAERDFAGGVDPASGAAGSTGDAALADVSVANAGPNQEPDSWCIAALQPRHRGVGSFRRQWESEVAGAPG
jgi:hypothetical protein